MASFGPISDDIHMDTARHLRIIEQGHVYLVARTVLVTPGRPYVVAEVAPDTLIEAPPGLERLTRSEMTRADDLAAALGAWSDGDDALARRESDARRRLTAAPRPASRAERAARAMHPSRLANAFHGRSLRSV